jgi:hypothetical protein
MRTYDVHAVTTASPAVVYRLLLDGATWPQWSKIETYSWEPDQNPPLSSVAEMSGVRVFRTGRNVTRERVTATLPDQMMAYEIEHGSWLLRNYEGRIDLEPEGGGGTHIRWRAQWMTPLPWVGSLMQRFLRQFQQDMIDGLAQFSMSLDTET